jgi:putative salt-induced outer membrane protein YdiY
VALLAAVLLGVNSFAESAIIHLKNGDRLTGKIVSESTNSLTLATPLLGTLQVPLNQIEKREIVPTPEPEKPGTNSIANAAAPANSPGTNAPPSAGTNTVAEGASATVPELKAKKPKPKLQPANPEAMPIASTPSLWKHDLRFGLNLHYAEQSSQEFLFIGKSTYGSPPWRHIFDVNFKYGHTEGVLSENSLDASEKTEYQLSPKTYLFGIVGGGYDEIRLIDVQYELGPGLGVELLKLTNFVWKTESGLNFQQQYRSDHTKESAFELRIAEIFAWHVWDKLTADTKAELFTNLGQMGEYRFRLEANLRYPVSDRISLNLDLIDLYDTESPDGVRPNDMQIRSTIGVSF